MSRSYKKNPWITDHHVKTTKEKKITNLHTKEDIVLPETKQIKFHTSKKLKNKINK